MAEKTKIKVGATDWTPKKKTWNEFRNSGLLWFINRMLHIFGWAIVFQCDLSEDGKEVVKITDVYPARVKFRGFQQTLEAEGFVQLTQHMKDNINEIYEESKLQA